MDLGENQSYLKLHQTPDPHQEKKHAPGNERDLKRSLGKNWGCDYFPLFYGFGKRKA